MRFDLWGSVTYGQNIPPKGLRVDFFVNERKTYETVFASPQSRVNEILEILRDYSRFGLLATKRCTIPADE